MPSRSSKTGWHLLASIAPKAKIPMFLFEMSALGARFAVTRWLASVSGIILMTFIMDRLVIREEKAAVYQKHGAGY
ncbi:MAG: hypothetical protein AB1700_07965 [Bacillota bacterium]